MAGRQKRQLPVTWDMLKTRRFFSAQVIDQIFPVSLFAAVMCSVAAMLLIIIHSFNEGSHPSVQPRSAFVKPAPAVWLLCAILQPFQTLLQAYWMALSYLLWHGAELWGNIAMWWGITGVPTLVASAPTLFGLLGPGFFALSEAYVNLVLFLVLGRFWQSQYVVAYLLISACSLVFWRSVKRTREVAATARRDPTKARGRSC